VSFVACTVATRRFLAQARVLAASFFEHNPGGRFAVLIPDDPDGEREVRAGVEELRPADIGIEDAELHRMALGYTPQELCCALRGRLGAFLVERGDAAVMLDSDVLVLGDLEPLAERARETGLALTAHSFDRVGPPEEFPPMIGWAPRRRNAFGIDQMLLRAGTFNAGVSAVAPGGEAFLRWWNARTRRFCLLQPGRSLFVEQGWLGLVPALFDWRLMESPGWNVNLFSLATRDLDWEGETPSLAGDPVRCLHFITFDPSRPGEFSSEPNIAAVWPSVEERPGAARVFRSYVERLESAGLAQARADTTFLERLPDGTEIDQNMRVAYAEALLRWEAGEAEEPPNPLADGDAEGFLRWLEEPWPDPPGFPEVSRYLVGFHARFDWVYGAFKEVPGADAERFLRWVPEAIERGDLELPERWIPDVSNLPDPPPPPAEVELQEQYRDLLAVLESERASLSWRVTAPLRRAAEMARRGRGA
jgi:hypothetical protein